MKFLLGKIRKSANMPGGGKVDIVSRLPFELHILVLSHLEPQDIDAGLSASHRWRNIWLSGEIWPRLADIWFPGLKDYIHGSVADEKSAGDMFRRTLHKVQKRVGGRFASALRSEMRLGSDQFTLNKSVSVKQGGVHSYADVDGLEPEFGQHFPYFMLYNNGRLAWWPEVKMLPYFAVVDDLRTRERRAYLFPGHRGQTEGFKTTMGDKLFLMGHGRTLHAWHLEKDRLCSIEIPQEFHRCSAEGETVLIVARNAQLFLWNFGHELQHVAVADFGRFKRGPLGSRQSSNILSEQYFLRSAGTRLVEDGTQLEFIVSPTERNVFFVVTFSQSPAYELQVHEIRNGELCGTYTLDKSEWSVFGMSPMTTGFRQEKADSYGGYSLLHAIFEPPRGILDTNGLGWDSTRHKTTCDAQSSSLRSVCFNIYTKSFTVLHCHNILCYTPPNPFQIWNGRIIVSDADSSGDPVVSLRACAGVAYPPVDPPPTRLYTTIPSGQGDLMRRCKVPPQRHRLGTEFADADFALDPCQRFLGELAQSNGIGLPRIVGDGEFLILVTEPSYIAWSFGGELGGEPAANGRRIRWKSLIR
ncbi:hypothetical protein GGS23DRAFT_507479 [Durotheca rogersii]|uniref:uncharacterized protein n=1 Tax=Durotheca rogersii TaxID=419775 RepID=UPI002220B0BB|nr:uncharacterized protein GGS23DRAFT_507479 [Durotheca rogersii]KAI5863633.1 hypothetical protein GGS23DRAFT_507479 [Durotheca rogersii]